MSEQTTAQTACSHPAFDEFVETIAALRAPDGCPWDREQTHASIAHNMIEEAYEAVDAIEHESVRHLREELGDVLLQVVLQSQIAADEGEFTIDDVVADINAKMIRRHPHVFGDATASHANDVLGLWEQVKLGEQKQAEAGGDGSPEGLLDGVPSSFPALMQAQKISRKAAAVGFDWDSLDAVWETVDEEIQELKQAYAQAPHSADGKVLKEADEAAAHEVELEFGDVLFSLVQIARHMGVNAENALRGACVKFRTRWSFMEGAAWGQGTTIDTLSADELEELWELAKAAEHARVVPICNDTEDSNE